MPHSWSIPVVCCDQQSAVVVCQSPRPKRCLFECFYCPETATASVLLESCDRNYVWQNLPAVNYLLQLNDTSVRSNDGKRKAALKHLCASFIRVLELTNPLCSWSWRYSLLSSFMGVINRVCRDRHAHKELIVLGVHSIPYWLMYCAGAPCLSTIHSLFCWWSLIGHSRQNSWCGIDSELWLHFQTFGMGESL